MSIGIWWWWFFFSRASLHPLLFQLHPVVLECFILSFSLPKSKFLLLCHSSFLHNSTAKAQTSVCMNSLIHLNLHQFASYHNGPNMCAIFFLSLNEWQYHDDTKYKTVQLFMVNKIGPSGAMFSICQCSYSIVHSQQHYSILVSSPGSEVDCNISPLYSIFCHSGALLQFWSRPCS